MVKPHIAWDTLRDIRNCARVVVGQNISETQRKHEAHVEVEEEE